MKYEFQITLVWGGEGSPTKIHTKHQGNHEESTQRNALSRRQINERLTIIAPTQTFTFYISKNTKTHFSKLCY
jgi:hypothetical protein